MKTFLVSALCGILVTTFMTATTACADTITASLDQVVFIGPKAYRLTVGQDDNLKITCVAGCKLNAVFDERIYGNLILGAYPIEDGILTLWAVGDGSLVRVYHVGDTGITKVLETPTRGQYPVLTSTDDGRPAIIVQGKTAGDLLRDQQQGISEPTHSVQGDLWVWNGHKYVMSSKP